MTQKNGAIAHAFYRIFDAMRDKSFAKSRKITEYSEKDLLIPIRFYLLGHFKNVKPEFKTFTDPGKNRPKRIDFLINDKIAIEFAVRSKHDAPNKVAEKANRTEVQKLIRWTNGPAILVLFDFSDSPLDKEVMMRFKLSPSLGKGNHNKSGYWIMYFWYDAETKQSKHLQIGTQIQHRKQIKNRA